MPKSRSLNPMARPDTWDDVAAAYQASFAPTFLPFAEDALRRAAPGPDAAILDVAAGPGTLSLLAAPMVGHVTALDFSPAMVARLREAAVRGGHTNVRVDQGDAAALPYKSARFDAVFCLFGLMFVPDRARALGELRRVLGPGGRTVVTTWPPNRCMPMFDVISGVLRRHVPSLPADDGRAPMGTLDEVRGELEAAGFRGVRAEQITHDLLYNGDPVTTWAGMERGNAPIALLRRSLPPELWDIVTRDAHDALRTRFGESPISIPLVANLGVGQ